MNTVEWEQSSTSLHDPPLDTGGIFVVWFDAEGYPHYGWTADPELAEILGEPMPPGEIRTIVGYVAVLQTGRGNTSLARAIRASSVGDNRGNIASVTHVAFHPEKDMGTTIFTEDLALDAAAAHTTEQNAVSSTFLPDDSPFNPPFCEFVETGSRILIAHGAFATEASAGFSRHPIRSHVAVDYSVSSGDQMILNDANGTEGVLEAFVRARAGGGLMVRVVSPGFDEVPHLPGFVPVEPSWIEYAEYTRAEGVIRKFSKEMHFNSGICR
ncbi:MAG: hypothetical protein QFX32_08465 [Methanolinea sp.]|nr:hypothetical protein [Methanolinea sp.]